MNRWNGYVYIGIKDGYPSLNPIQGSTVRIAIRSIVETGSDQPDQQFQGRNRLDGRATIYEAYWPYTEAQTEEEIIHSLFAAAGTALGLTPAELPGFMSAFEFIIFGGIGSPKSVSAALARQYISDHAAEWEPQEDLP